MVGHRLPARPRRPTAAASAEGGVRKERKRRQGQPGRKRAGEAIKRAHRAAKPDVDSGTLPTGSLVEKEIEEGSVDDVEAENIENEFGLPIEKQIQGFRRLFKKRANMALVLYHKNHPDEQYQFLQVGLNEVYTFIDYRLQDPYHMHMNFVALNVKTGMEKIFFAELCIFNDVDDGNSGFVATTCEIVDGNSAGGRRIKHPFKDGKFPPDYYDIENCYACAERIKHPPGASYRAGHDVLGYDTNEESFSFFEKNNEESFSFL